MIHRLILGAKPGEIIDHKNRNRFDNRRENLRLCTVQQNNWNVDKHSGTSRFKGVRWLKNRRKWQAEIRRNDGKHLYLGMFESEEEAARAYDEAAVRFRGEFAVLNFS